MNQKSKLGRPLKLTPEMIEALCEYVKKGNYAEHACYLCGIDESTLYLWLKKGQQDVENEEDTIFSDLFKAIKRAKAQAQAEMIEVARNSAKVKKDGYLAVTVLERTDPSRWGRRDRLQVEETKREEIKVIVEHYPAGLEGDAEQVVIEVPPARELPAGGEKDENE
jgi:transposase